MASIMQGILNAEFSRRNFLKGTVAATAAVAGLGLLPKESALAESTAPVEHAPIVDPEEGGKPDDAFCGHLGYASFIRDPEANPLATASGKFEITSQTKADLFNGFGFIDWDYKPYPEYITPTCGFEGTFKDKNIDGEKGEFPYLLYNIHYLRRSHTTFNNCPWLRETWPNPVFINASDAREHGIESGDTVLITTRTAQALRKACVMEGLMPGVVAIPHGAWENIDEKTGIDHGGADNYLLGNEITGSGITPYNNINCRIEKYDGPELVSDIAILPDSGMTEPNVLIKAKPCALEEDFRELPT